MDPIINVAGTPKLNEALSKAQAQMTTAAMSGSNPHFGNKFSTITDLWEASRKALTSNGLSIHQGTEMMSESRMGLRTALLHSSGEERSFVVPLIIGKQDMQGLGSAISYAKRFGLGMALGIASEEDDDANESVAQTNAKPKYETKAESKHSEWPWAWEMTVKGQKHFIGDMTLDQINWLIDDLDKVKTKSKSQEAGLKALKAAGSTLKKQGEQGNAGGATKTAGSTGSTNNGTGEASQIKESYFEDTGDIPF